VITANGLDVLSYANLYSKGLYTDTDCSYFVLCMCIKCVSIDSNVKTDVGLIDSVKVAYL